MTIFLAGNMPRVSAIGDGVLSILIFGGGSLAPFLQATKIVKKQQNRILVDTAREREDNQSLNNIKKLYKGYQKSCRELASPGIERPNL